MQSSETPQVRYLAVAEATFTITDLVATATLPASAFTITLYPVAQMNVHRFNFNEADVPTGLCDLTGPARLHGGTATGTSSRDGPVDLDLFDSNGRSPTVFGDVDGDHVDEAGLNVFCVAQGGNGVLGQGFVLYRVSGSKVVSFGVINARYQPPQTFLSGVDSITIGRGKVTAMESWYQATDAHCCPTGHATTTWTYNADNLVAGTPRITH